MQRVCDSNVLDVVHDGGILYDNSTGEIYVKWSGMATVRYLTYRLLLITYSSNCNRIPMYLRQEMTKGQYMRSVDGGQVMIIDPKKATQTKIDSGHYRNE